MRLAPVALLAVLLVAPAASAQKMSPAEARATFKEAQELYQADRCKDALPRFEKLAKATDSPNAQLYVARCLRKLERIPEAYEAYSAAIRVADAKSKDDARYADTRSAAAAERAALESKVARVMVAIADPPEGLKVRLGDIELAADRVGEPIAVSPGSLDISATAPGRAEFKRTLEVKGGSLSTVAVVFPSAADTANGGSETPVEGPADSGATNASTSSGPPILAYVALGVGAAGLATFGVAGYLADQRFKSLEDDCKGGPCPEAKRGDIDGGRRLDTIANIGLVVGGVGLASGTALLLFGGKSKEAPPATEAFVSPTIGGANVVVTRRF